MSKRGDLIDTMLAARERMISSYKPEEGARVLYYPPALVERAKIFWGSGFRIEPTPQIPNDADT